jgi:hypothetical protein
MAQETVGNARRLRDLAAGYITARLIYVVAKLGIADLVAERPFTANELAKRVGADPDVLHSVLRTLAGQGVFHEDAHGGFTLTSLSHALRSDASDSIRDYVILMHEGPYRAWSECLHTVMSGQPAFEKEFGESQYSYMANNSEAAAQFHAAMAAAQRIDDPALVEAYNFSQTSQVVDLGGGNGSLLSAILTRNNHLTGVLFEQESAIQAAKSGLGGPLPRCKFVVGDFFKSIVPGANLYLLKRVLHNYSDERVVTILRNCCEAFTANARVLIIEAVIGPANEPSWGMMQDMVMRFIVGGKERTEEEYEALLERAGLRKTRTLSTPSDLMIIEATAV